MPQTSASEDRDRPLSIPDLVLQAESYSALLSSNSNEVDSNPASAKPSPANAVRSSSASLEQDSVHRPPPKISVTDLVLDDITYDAILASSTKGLYLHPSSSALPSSSVHAPPNTPATAEMNRYGSLVGTSAEIMESNGNVTRSRV